MTEATATREQLGQLANVTADKLLSSPLLKTRKKYLNQMLAGLGLIIGSALLTTGLDLLAHAGGSYVIFYGGLAAGGISFLIGLFKYTLTY